VSRVGTVLFDIGGVLTNDPWQSLLLTPERGLAARLGLDPDDVSQAAEKLWPKYSLAPGSEHDYWHELGALLSVGVPAEMVRQAERDCLVVDEAWASVLARLGQRRTAWGFISDNTSFWYAKQIGLLGGARPAPEREFVSFSRGLSKSTPGHGLFEVAARTLDPGETVVVDDRRHNLERAEAVGYRVVDYTMTQPRSLAEALAPLL
jgi:FMN phosphatase YigB (HAD superfamily)